MARIIVDPAKLKSAAGKMESQSADYARLYNQLFTEVQGMARAWQGVDNQAYTTQIEGFREDLNQMKKLMDDYASFLKQSAETYTNTQQQVVSQAKTLTN